MRQKCRKCRHFGLTVTHVWYDRRTGQQHRDTYINHCVLFDRDIIGNKSNQYNNCDRFEERKNER